MHCCKVIQRKSDRRWEYRSYGNGSPRPGPTGYCQAAPDPAESADFRESPTFQARYHVDGHATQAEACACYAQYLVDHCTRFRMQTAIAGDGTLPGCSVCGEPTFGIAELGEYAPRVPLCETHQTQEDLHVVIRGVTVWYWYDTDPLVQKG